MTFPTTKQKEYVIPEDVFTTREETRLMQIRDGEREDNFWVGKLANRKIRKTAMAGLPITAKDIYHQIGRMLGKSDRTIRYYAEVEASYPDWVPDHYDILPFSFFDYARAKDNWGEVLDYAMEHPSYSLSAIRRKFDVEDVGSGNGETKSTRKKSRTQAVAKHSLINAISDLCDTLLDLAQEVEDEQIEREIENINTSLKELIARVVDRRTNRV